jgi:hypothetical protein
MTVKVVWCPCGLIATHGLRCKKHKDKLIEKPKKIQRYSGYSEAYLKSKGAEKADD